MDEVTKRRLTHNEDLFREVNEAREEASGTTDGSRLSFVCECADRECTDLIELTIAEFERVRASESRYVIVPGHDIPELERIVEERGAFAVVEKDAA